MVVLPPRTSPPPETYITSPITVAVAPCRPEAIALTVRQVLLRGSYSSTSVKTPLALGCARGGMTSAAGGIMGVGRWFEQRKEVIGPECRIVRRRTEERS